MNKAKWKVSITCLVVCCLLVAAQMTYAGPYFRLDTQDEWSNALAEGRIRPVTLPEWLNYMGQWSAYLQEGGPYPSTTFEPPQLWVYGGGGGGGLNPSDAGLVMYWHDWGTMPLGSYASAVRYDYQLDPDLSNCIITVTVTAPRFDLLGNQINTISLGLQNPPLIGGPIRAWHWNCGAPGSGAPIIWNTPTVITIDTSRVGLAAATPVANGYMSNPAFNIRNVQWILVDENCNWVGGPAPAPAPGSGLIGMWNYWHNLMVTKKTTPNKGYYIKWSQPPVIIDDNDPPIINGWDERSDFNNLPIVADDWECNDTRPVTDIHWWGSFIGWNQPNPPPIMPRAFHIGIWTDVPDPDPCNPFDYSEPNRLVWENICTCYVWNFAGYDRDPRMPESEWDETCFQFNQLLSQDEWFYQDPNESNGIYWLSISAIYNPEDYSDPNFHPFGWKTRPHYFNDDAVRVWGVSPPWPLLPAIGSVALFGQPIWWPDPYNSWDMAFELTTNEPPPPTPEPPDPDFDDDGIVTLLDFAVFADYWLVSVGP